jgi:hypothetical protein
MRLKSLLIAGAVAFSSTQVNAQAWVDDSVTMGPSYANDVFYSLKNGAQPAVSNMNWHLAFQTIEPGPGNVSILANHAQGGVKVYSLHMRAATNFTTLTAADTVGKTGATRELFNADTNWNFGAFNRMNNPADVFDFSWGMYNTTTHHVVGDSLYLVTITNLAVTEAYKVWVKQYVSTPADSVQWQVRIAKFDGSEDTSFRIYRKPAFTDRLFAYYNIVTKTIFDREPSRYSWDILFTRYKEYLAGAPGVPYYNVMGVLSNFGVTVYEKKKAGPDDTVGYGNYAYSATLNEIGSDWKTFNNTTMQWTFADSTYYFVKTKNTNEYYQLHFTNFGGTANGKVFFKKRFLGAYVNSISGINTPIQTYKLVPNPANNDVSVLIDTKESVKNARLIVTDLTGKVVFSSAVNVNGGLNAYTINTSSVAAGTYVVTLTNGAWKATEKLIVQH